jgi:hypothetical protein
LRWSKKIIGHAIVGGRINIAVRAGRKSGVSSVSQDWPAPIPSADAAVDLSCTESGGREDHQVDSQRLRRFRLRQQ